MQVAFVATDFGRLTRWLVRTKIKIECTFKGR